MFLTMIQHYGKPVCCPTITAPKNCIWRGDNNGKGSSRDCSAQCWAGEVNMAGIMSSLMASPTTVSPTSVQEARRFSAAQILDFHS
jgi:hypothetical protein